MTAVGWIGYYGPVSERTFLTEYGESYVATQFLYAGTYGEVYAAHDITRRPLQLTRLSDELQGRPGYAEALARYGAELGVLSHHNVVTTKVVTRVIDGSLLVLCEDLARPVS